MCLVVMLLIVKVKANIPLLILIKCFYDKV